MNKKQAYSYICFGAALFLFLFASVDEIELNGEQPEDLTNQKALDIAKTRGLWPMLANYRMEGHIGNVPGSETLIVRHVGVAYLGNILIMILFLITGVALHFSVTRPRTRLY